MVRALSLIGDPRRGYQRGGRVRLRPGLVRLAALAAAGATGLVVTSGALHLGLTHRVLAMPAVPLLAAVVIAAAAHTGELLVVLVAALALFAVESGFGGVVAFTGRPEWAVVLHVVLAGLALAAALLTAAESFRGEHLPAGAWRERSPDQPRIMLLLLITAAAGMFVGAGGLPDLPELAVVLAGGALRARGRAP